MRFFLKFLLRNRSNPSTLCLPLQAFIIVLCLGYSALCFLPIRKITKGGMAKYSSRGFYSKYEKRKKKHTKCPHQWVESLRTWENTACLLPDCLHLSPSTNWSQLEQITKTTSDHAANDAWIGWGNNNWIVPLEVNFQPDNWIRHICLVKKRQKKYLTKGSSVLDV